MSLNSKFSSGGVVTPWEDWAKVERPAEQHGKKIKNIYSRISIHSTTKNSHV